MPVRIEPEPPEPVRQAIVAALAGGVEVDRGAWSETALAEGVEEDDLDP